MQQKKPDNDISPRIQVFHCCSSELNPLLELDDLHMSSSSVGLACERIKKVMKPDGRDGWRCNFDN